MAKPEVLMLDEPSLGLSPVLREETFRVVKRIAETGVTIMLVEQDVKHSLSIENKRMAFMIYESGANHSHHEALNIGLF